MRFGFGVCLLPFALLLSRAVFSTACSLFRERAVRPDITYFDLHALQCVLPTLLAAREMQASYRSMYASIAIVATALSSVITADDSHMHVDTSTGGSVDIPDRALSISLLLSPEINALCTLPYCSCGHDLPHNVEISSVGAEFFEPAQRTLVQAAVLQCSAVFCGATGLVQVDMRRRGRLATCDCGYSLANFPGISHAADDQLIDALVYLVWLEKTLHPEQNNLSQ